MSHIPARISVSAISLSDADGVEIELRELAIAALVGLIRAPDRRDLVAAERAGRSLYWAMTRASGTVRSKRSPSVFLLGIGDAEDRLLRFLPRAAGEDVEVLDGRRAEGHEAIKLVDAADGVDHLLAGQHLIGQEVAEAAGEPRDEHFCISGL